jgi:cytochrome c biogenesis protein CcmG, thiol:disulfide interchange protein DsbE
MKAPSAITAARWAILAMLVVVLVATFRGRLFRTTEPLRPQHKRAAFPSFALKDLEGSSWSSKDHRGEVLLVNFWATWCPPCREETPDLIELQKRFGTRGFTVVGVNMDDRPAETVPSFVHSFKVNYPILLPNPEFVLADAVESLPTSFLIDRNGGVARSFVGQASSEELTAQIEALLKESAAAQQARLFFPRGF